MPTWCTLSIHTRVHVHNDADTHAENTGACACACELGELGTALKAGRDAWLVGSGLELQQAAKALGEALGRILGEKFRGEKNDEKKSGRWLPWRVTRTPDKTLPWGV